VKRAVHLVCRRLAFGMVFSCALVLSEAKAEFQMLGAGVASCGKWLADRASGDYYSMGNWALGFLSGVGWSSVGYDPLKGLDSHAVAYWLDNYCKAHPTAEFDSALVAFIEERAH
jgi:hypothetical protein